MTCCCSLKNPSRNYWCAGHFFFSKIEIRCLLLNYVLLQVESLTDYGDFLQAQHSLHRDEECRNVEGFEEDLCSLLPVLARVERSLCQQNRMLQRTPNTRTKDQNGTVATGTAERRSSPLQRTSAAAPWSKRTARSSPCHSSRSRFHVPWDIVQTTNPCVPERTHVVRHRIFTD